MKILKFLILAALLSGCATTKTNYVKYQRQEVQQQRELFLDINSAEIVPFHGQIEDANLNSSPNGMMYPGYSAGGFIASILTHAVIADSVKDSKQKELQDLADEEISVISSAFEQLSYKSLIELTPEINEDFHIKKNEVDLANDNSQWSVNITPIYYLRSDLSGLTLKNIVRVFDVTNIEEPLYENLIEVLTVTGLNDREQNAAFWTSDDGIHLQRSASQLLWESLILFKSDFNAELPSDRQQQTFKLMIGANIFVERGSLIRESCDETVFRSLRGWLKSVPTALRTNTKLDCIAES